MRRRDDILASGGNGTLYRRDNDAARLVRNIRPIENDTTERDDVFGRLSG